MPSCAESAVGRIYGEVYAVLFRCGEHIYKVVCGTFVKIKVTLAVGINFFDGYTLIIIIGKRILVVHEEHCPCVIDVFLLCCCFCHIITCTYNYSV